MRYSISQHNTNCPMKHISNCIKGSVSFVVTLKNTTTYIFKENMKLFVLLWVNSGLKQRKEYVLQNLSEIRHKLLWPENITETHKKWCLDSIFLELFLNLKLFSFLGRSTYYILGTWIIHLMFGECNLWWINHLDRLSHSSGERP